MTILLVGAACAVDPDLGRFATAKQRQVREYAEALTNKLPSIVWSFFDAVRVDDWETATNLAARLDQEVALGIDRRAGIDEGIGRRREDLDRGRAGDPCRCAEPHRRRD